MGQYCAYYRAHKPTGTPHYPSALGAGNAWAEAIMAATSRTTADSRTGASSDQSANERSFSPAPHAGTEAFNFGDVFPPGRGGTDRNLFGSPYLKRAGDGMLPLKGQLHLLSRPQLGNCLPIGSVLRGQQRGEQQEYGAPEHGLPIIAEHLETHRGSR